MTEISEIRASYNRGAAMRKLVWKAVALKVGLAAAAVWLLAHPGEVAAQPVLENNQIQIYYSEPNASYFRPIYERYKSRQVLEQLKQFLSPLIIPGGITLQITAKECGTVNSWWSGRKDGLFLCYEWPDFAERVAPAQTMPDGMTREDAVVGAFLQVTFHELGHGMFDIYDIPVFGREEDAADQMAGFILSQFGKDVARRTFPGVVYLWQKLAESDGPVRRSAYADEHGTDLQRAYNYLCMAYGADPVTFQYVVDKGLLPKERAANCARESRQIYNAFTKTMIPHIDKSKMEVVRSKDWLLPEGSEPVPK
jgi:Putative metallopeptidase